jgi:hypothetical protein
MTKRRIVILALFVSVIGFAQKNNSSPYSFFGIGDKNELNTVEQLSRGGVGVSFSDIYHLNLSNPASFASLQFTNYSIAGESVTLWAKDNENDKQRAAATYLSYLAIGIPLGEKGGMSFGLVPNSTVGYSLLSNVYDTDDTILEGTIYEGTGGTNRVFFGVGYEIFKGFNIGAQGNYVFGKIENTITNQLLGASLASRYNVESNLKGYAFNLGFQYNAKINEKVKLHLGANMELANDIDTEDEEYLYSVSLVNFESPRDTILSNKSNGIIANPLKSTIGIGLGEENKWFAGVDYSFQKAIEIDGEFNSNASSRFKYGDYSSLSIGGFYTPKINSLLRYWERVTYRAGVKFEKTGLLVDPTNNGNNYTEINDFGISFGVGLPLSSQTLSNLNFGIEIGKRGKNSNGLVQEDYVNFRIGLSLNDKWFKKREIF